jgi:hypothetical protein
MNNGKIHPAIVVSNDLSQTITNGYYDTDTNSSSSESTPRDVDSSKRSSSHKIQHKKLRVSPISNISSERNELLQAQSMMQRKIRNSINNIDFKIQKKNVKYKREIDKLNERRLRLIKEFNNGVLEQHERIRGTTPPDKVNVKNIEQHKKVGFSMCIIL